MSMVESIAQKARNAFPALSKVAAEEKTRLLEKIADLIWLKRQDILDANKIDMEKGERSGLTPALIDRLRLDEKRLMGILNDLRQVAALPDPVGEVFDESILPNGLQIYKQRVPLGVLAVIYESRPNVTIDVAGLALKTGNCVILRGGSETIHTNSALVKAIKTAIDGSAIPTDAVQFIDDPDRARISELLKLHQYIDMLIPRGGETLHRFCRENSTIPVITGGIGICHLFVDDTADLGSSLEVIRNAKVQKPSVCNALDTLLVHQNIAAQFLPMVVSRLKEDGVTFRAEPQAYQLLKEYENVVFPAQEKDFDTEWLSLVLSLKVVQNLDEAIHHIRCHSTQHSDGILTQNSENADRFISEVDSAAVYVNASTRFTDGGQFGLGAEVAISTQRLHARGPMGLRELTTYKWVVRGNYQVRP